MEMVVAKLGRGEETKGIKVEAKEASPSLYLRSLRHSRSQIKEETKAEEIKMLTVETVEARAGIKVETRESNLCSHRRPPRHNRRSHPSKEETKGEGIKVVMEEMAAAREATGEGTRATRVETKVVMTLVEIRGIRAETKESNLGPYLKFPNHNLSPFNPHNLLIKEETKGVEIKATKAGIKEVMKEIRAETKAVAQMEIRGIKAETREGNLGLHLRFLHRSLSQFSPRSLRIKEEIKGVETMAAMGEEIKGTKVGIKGGTTETKGTRETRVGIKGATKETKVTRKTKEEIKEVGISSLPKKEILAASV